MASELQNSISSNKTTPENKRTTDEKPINLIALLKSGSLRLSKPSNVRKRLNEYFFLRATKVQAMSNPKKKQKKTGIINPVNKFKGVILNPLR